MMVCDRGFHVAAALGTASLVLALLPCPVRARELSRKMIVPLALQQNPQVAAARAVVAGAESRKAQADAARWPIVSLEAGTGPALRAELVGDTGIQSRESAYAIGWGDLSVFVGGRLEVTQPLYTFGKIGRRREAAASEIEARTAQLRVEEARIAVEAACLYEGYLYARDARRFFEEALRIIDDSIDKTQEQLKHESQSITPQDLLRLQAARQIAVLGLDQATARAGEALAGLRAYLGLPESEEISPTEEELTPISGKVEGVERLTQTAIEKRPEIAALVHGAAAYEELAAAEMAAYFPDFFALGFVSAAYTPGRDLVNTRYYRDPVYHFLPGFVLGLRWQIWGPMAFARAEEARAQARHLEALRQWAVQGVPAQVHKEYLEAQQALDDMKAAEEGVSRSKKWVVRATADYAIGVVTTRDVTDALQSYAALRLAYLDAVYRRNTSLVRLAQAAGTLLEQGAGPYGGNR